MLKRMLLLNTVMFILTLSMILFAAGFVMGNHMDQEDPFAYSIIPVVNNEDVAAVTSASYSTMVLEFADKFGISECKFDIMQKIVDEAHKQGVDPGLALAVGFTESSFNHDSKSKAGAVGVMQLMPIWGDDIHHLDVNIEKGIALIKERLDKYDGDEYKTLKYYNGGWKAFSESHAKVRRRTSTYAKKVIRIRNKLGGVYVYDNPNS